MPVPEPALAVVLDIGSANPFEIAAATRAVARPVFVVDDSLPYIERTLPGIAAVWDVCDISGCSDIDAADKLRAHDPAGIITFSEYQLARTARLAAACGLPFHEPGVVESLTDKAAQRRVLADAGVQATRHAVIRTRDDVAPAAATVAFPAVLKPRRGAASRDTVRVDDEAALHLAVRDLLTDGRELIVEEMLVGSLDGLDDRWGDYVSVESVNTPDAVHHVCVTGKFALSPPFRESGMILPAPLPGDVLEAVRDLTTRALRALRVRHGVTHTELKLTASGPRVIEVNGRVGGYVGEILQRATGFSLAGAAVRTALGLPVTVPDLRFDGVTYQYFLTPPQGRWTLTDPGDIEPLKKLDGVRRVDMRAEAGQVVDTALGTDSLLGVVFGKAPDLDALADVVGRIDAQFRPALARAEPAGHDPVG